MRSPQDSEEGDKERKGRKLRIILGGKKDKIAAGIVLILILLVLAAVTVPLVTKFSGSGCGHKEAIAWITATELSTEYVLFSTSAGVLAVLSLIRAGAGIRAFVTRRSKTQRIRDQSKVVRQLTNPNFLP